MKGAVEEAGKARAPDAKHLRNQIRNAIIGATLLHGAAMVQVWGNWSAVGIVFAALVVLHAFNAWWSIHAERHDVFRAELVRLVVNVVGLILEGWATGWVLAIWMFIPFSAVLHDGLKQTRSLQRIVLYLVGINSGALLTGASILDAAFFSGLALFVHQVCSDRASFCQAVLSEREAALSALAGANRKLEAAHREALSRERLASIGLLAAGVAHEINNPMSYVSANLRALDEELRAVENLPPSMIEFRDEVIPETLDGVRRVNSIVGDLRRFARGEPDRHAPVDVNTEVSAAIRMAKTQFAAGQQLIADIEPVPSITGHARQISQLALNLIANAREAAGPTGCVRVRTAQVGPEIVIAVSDTGPGMSAEVQTRLFEPFFTTKSPGAGTGLGLSVVHGIVTAHGGRVEVDSAPGNGATFTVRLPLPKTTAVAVS